MTVLYEEERIKRFIKQLFLEEQLITHSQVADYLGFKTSAIRQHALKGNLVPIFSRTIDKTQMRIYYYPDIVLFKQYIQTKHKNADYDAYHKMIQTIDRKRVAELLAKHIWVSKDVCTYLSIGLTALDGLIKRKQLTPIFKLTERNTRLFFVNDVKLLKIDYDAYLKFQKNKK